MANEVNPPAWRTSDGPPAPLAGVTTLGAVVRAYEARERALLDQRPLLVLGGVLVGIGLAMAVVAAATGGIGATLAVVAVTCVIGGAPFVVYAANMRRMRRSARCAVVYDDGFATLVGATVGVWPWADVTAIVSNETLHRSNRGARVWTYHVYEISMRSGETVVIDDVWFDDVRPLIASIKDRVFALLRPRLQSTYASGAPLTFGAVTVSKDSVEGDGRKLAWNDVREAVVEMGCLVVKPNSGAPLKVRVSRIPNVEILGMLIGVDPAKMALAYI